MRLRRIATVVAVVVLAAGGTAAAGESRSLTFVPDLAGPGDLVTVKTDACATTSTGLVYTKDLAGTVLLGPVGSGDSEGYFRVPGSARPGSYTIRGVCGDGTAVGGVLRIPESWIGEPAA